VDWKERVVREIEEFVKKRKEYLDREVECIKEEIDKIVQKYLETLKEIPELPKLIDKDIVFAKTIDLDEVMEKIVSPEYIVVVEVNKWDKKISVRIGGNTLGIPFEEGLKMKLVFYK